MSISDELLDEGGAFHNVRAAEFGAMGTGGVDDGPAFVAAGAKGHILVAAGTYRIDDSLTISRPVRFVDGAVLRPANGVVITLDGPVEAGPYKIFDLSLGGTVAFTRNSAERLYPQWWGAVGDGAVGTAPIDTAAIQDAVAAAGAVKATVAFPPGTTHRILQTIYGAAAISWEFNDTTFVADAGDGEYDDIRDQSGASTGLKVFFAVDGGLQSIYHGRLWLDGKNVPNLCGMSGKTANNNSVQRWESVVFRNFDRGIYALDQNNGNTLVGFSFGTVDFRQCGVDIYLDGSGSDDLVFDVVRSHGSVDASDAGKSNIYLERAYGVVIRSLFIRGQRNDRHGLHLANISSLVCDHLYVEGDFAAPVLVTDERVHLWAGDIKVSINPFSSTNGEVVRVDQGATSCLLDMTFNDKVTDSPLVTHIVRIQANNLNTYGRAIILRLPFPSAAVTPVLYVPGISAGASDADNVIVYAKGGVYRYTYDGSTTTERLYPLINGGTVAAAGPVGNVVRRMEVFDANGNSLGFVPIYDSIT